MGEYNIMSSINLIKDNFESLQTETGASDIACSILVLADVIADKNIVDCELLAHELNLSLKNIFQEESLKINGTMVNYEDEL